MEEKTIIAIRKEDVVAADSAFSYLMRKTEDNLNEKARRNVQEYKNLTASQLEDVSKTTIQECCEGTPFRHDEIKLISGFRFPDIIAEQYYGVEVKSTNKNHWTSTGSSFVVGGSKRNSMHEYQGFVLSGRESADCGWANVEDPST